MKSQNKKVHLSDRAAKNALNFFAEAGLLKRVKRSGWWVVGIDNPESVADHCFRTSVIGFYLAHLEGADPYKVAAMAIFNDIHEARINDLHKMGHFYIDFKKAEEKVFTDQLKSLALKVRGDLEVLRKDYDAQISKESLVARDSDILECLLQAKEYFDYGYEEARNFLKRAPEFLKTQSAKAIWRTLRKWKSSHWWQDIVKFER